VVDRLPAPKIADVLLPLGTVSVTFPVQLQVPAGRLTVVVEAVTELNTVCTADCEQLEALLQERRRDEAGAADPIVEEARSFLCYAARAKSGQATIAFRCCRSSSFVSGISELPPEGQLEEQDQHSYHSHKPSR